MRHVSQNKVAYHVRMAYISASIVHLVCLKLLSVLTLPNDSDWSMLMICAFHYLIFSQSEEAASKEIYFQSI